VTTDDPDKGKSTVAYAGEPLIVAGAPATIDLATSYRLDGTLQNSRQPALGGLPEEIVSYGYTALGQVTSITGSTGYLLDADYSALGQVQQLALGTANIETHKTTYITNTLEQGTGRLTRSHVTVKFHPDLGQRVFTLRGRGLAATRPAFRVE
jgi:hypothetical protein